VHRLFYSIIMLVLQVTGAFLAIAMVVGRAIAHRWRWIANPVEA
jgi:hypothetical protein